jgi:hypothetical protein
VVQEKQQADIYNSASSVHTRCVLRAKKDTFSSGLRVITIFFKMATADLSSICWLACPKWIRIRTAFELILIKPHSAFNLFMLEVLHFVSVHRKTDYSVLFCFLWDVQSLSNPFYCVTLHTPKLLCSFSVIFCVGLPCIVRHHSTFVLNVYWNLIWCDCGYFKRFPNTDGSLPS